MGGGEGEGLEVGEGYPLKVREFGWGGLWGERVDKFGDRLIGDTAFEGGGIGRWRGDGEV